MLCSVPIKVNHLNIVLLQALLCVCVWIYAWKIPFNNSSRLSCKLENVVKDCSYFWGILVNMTISCPAIKQLHDLASISVLPILNLCSGYGVLTKSLNFSGDVATLWLVYPLCSICQVHCNLSFLPISLLVRLSPDASNPQIQWQNSVLIPLDFFMPLKMVDPTLLETLLALASSPYTTGSTFSCIFMRPFLLPTLYMLVVPRVEFQGHCSSHFHSLWATYSCAFILYPNFYDS